MTHSAFTWPEGRPPHMVQIDPHLSVNGSLENVILHHIASCAECKDWAEEHSHDFSLWIYPAPS